jgi:uncharacterized protein YyaL (SSP411 family)
MNKLIHETSPYLLQHAHNPVNWYPWGEEALQLAQQLDKPILVSIGYSACHWCHVMERESFEDEYTAALMNEYFINIKIDREERPDLDHIYMDAVQNMTGSGGWPLNVFLTPAAKPFYGGTYYPPKRVQNRASWAEVLHAVNDAYQNKKNDVLAHADKLTEQLANANHFGMSKPGEQGYASPFNNESLEVAASNILQNADKTWGGFGRAPKFPQTFSIQYLLRHYYFTGSQAALNQALLSIDRMIQGGIYDHIGGGFARYSTDNEWFAPHFEKMLYDNALLVTVISEAYQVTGNPVYAAVIRQTMAFMQREMLSPEKLFYSALDADSEGVEGKFYVWTKAEIEAILGDDARLFCEVYNITEAGNWEHSNIIWIKQPLRQVLAALGEDEAAAEAVLQQCREKLLAARASRVRPGLDDKILTGWNAMMITACCKAYSALGNKEYLQMAEDCISSLESACSQQGWQHTYKNAAAKYPAFLDDCAALIQAYIQLQQVTGKAVYLNKAKKLTTQVIETFSDEQGVFFYFTPAGQQDIVVRKKEVYDGATPSGNALMAHNLYYLSVVFDETSWRSRAEAMVASIGQAAVKYPVSFGCWATALQNITQGLNEIAVIGPGFEAVLKGLNRKFIPNCIIQASPAAADDYPLLTGKAAGAGEALIYVCKNYACQQPVVHVEEALLLLKINP